MTQAAISRGRNGDRHRKTEWSVAVHSAERPAFPTLAAAVKHARPALLRLFDAWMEEQRGQVAEFSDGFAARHGQSPSPADIASALGMGEAAATWFLEQAS
jgi:hypothetical protein